MLVDPVFGIQEQVLISLYHIPQHMYIILKRYVQTFFPVYNGTINGDPDPPEASHACSTTRCSSMRNTVAAESCVRVFGIGEQRSVSVPARRSVFPQQKHRDARTLAFTFPLVCITI